MKKEKTCSNCGFSSFNGSWRRNPITRAQLCNPCGLWFKKHGNNRPKDRAEAITKSPEKKHPSGEMCYSCGTDESSVWRYKKIINRLMCNSCALYFKKRNTFSARYVDRKIKAPFVKMIERCDVCGVFEKQLGYATEEQAHINHCLLCWNVKKSCNEKTDFSFLNFKSENKPLLPYRVPLFPSLRKHNDGVTQIENLDFLNTSFISFPFVPRGKFVPIQQDIIVYCGISYCKGDIVCVKGFSLDYYLARITGFYLTEFQQKIFSMSWLIMENGKVASMTRREFYRITDKTHFNKLDKIVNEQNHDGLESFDSVVFIIRNNVFLRHVVEC